MTYRGNPALPPDTQRRIQGTFEQTLELAEDGNRQEALLGCDFILRMDPRFEPARRLQQRLQGASGAVHVRDLRDGAPGPAPAPPPEATAAPPAEELWGGLDLEELPDLPPLDFETTGPGELATEPAAAGGRAALRAELTELLERRAFDAVLTAAARERQAVADDPELFALVETAQSRLEAEPYVAKFLAAAHAARQAGNDAEAERLLAKARALDPSHPEVAAPAAAPPPAPPPVPFAAESLFADTAEFDRRAALAAAGAESDGRIAELLAEGQAAFDRADYQNAIDAWSRIFLIDIDHQEAARRIEEARKLKAEGERQVEEVFHDGLAQLDAGDTAAARRAFERVLELQPGHLAARELLQEIEAGKTPVARPAAAALSAAALESAFRDGAAAPAGEELKEEILVPPEPGEVRRGERPAPAAAAAPRGRGLRTFALVGGAVALLVLAGAWFLFQNRARLFPNSAEEPGAAAPADVDPIARAAALHRQGRTPLAIAQLRRLPPDDPRYARAQALVRQWETGAPAAAAPPALAPEQAARRAELVSAASAALAGQDYLAAVDSLERAAAVRPLAAPEAELLRQARAGLAPLQPQLTLFEQQDWEFVVPQLWRLREANPRDPAVNRLLVDSYHNLGVQALQRGDAGAAESHFAEALELAPRDEEARRHLLFAETYQQRAPDLLYRIYVKHLPYR